MAATFVRTATYQMLGREQVLRLKKWSVAKFYTLIRVIGEILGKVDATLKLSDVSDSKRIGGFLVAVADEIKTPLLRIVMESVEDPALVEADILDWDPEDFFGVLREIVTMNVTEELGKNLAGLRDVLLPKKK